MSDETERMLYAALLKSEERCATLMKLLRHEIHGSNPCHEDCITGGYRNCLGCDARVKAVGGWSDEV
jgi:hypothetical protein